MFNNSEEFGYEEGEAELRIDQLKALDKAHAKGELYPECPRCKGECTITVIVKMSAFYRSTEDFSCPLCGGTGEADIERAEKWILEQIEDNDLELSDEDQKYFDERKPISD